MSTSLPRSMDTAISNSVFFHEVNVARGGTVSGGQDMAVLSLL